MLPGLAFKAVVIGGGYATGREIAEFFLPAGPWGGIAAMAVATAIWCVVCSVTFVFARRLRERDYRSFFRALLGRAWPVFEIAYLIFVVLILAVFGAAAGAIGAATFGVAPIVGTLCLMVAIALATAFGNKSVERVFTWVSILLYGVYAAFVVFAITSFGDRISQTFATAEGWNDGWLSGGLTYAGYNIIGAVVILPVTRHLTSDRDAIVAGMTAGPLAMLPAFLFFICMCAFVPAIAGEALPSDYLLARLDQPWFRYLFQIMIFAALLESGTGAVHAVNERISTAWQARSRTALSTRARGAIALALLVVCMLIADRVGLVALIANGYRALAYLLIAVYVVPLLTIGLWKLWKGGQSDWVTP
ncbi:MAG TPA: hypothetical protein VFO82_16305 [Steroidobacteraceae bacterium]|nr:hypothetical protein [Steroidobacteraceae bacterium]